MADDEAQLSAEEIELAVVVKELLAVLPKPQARAFLRGMSFTMSGRDGWNTVVPIRPRQGDAGADPAAAAAAWWTSLAPEYRRLVRAR